MAPPLRTLDQLRLGESASISSLRGEGALTQRILALGLLPGSRIVVVGVAPLGDPLTIDSAVGRISIRKSEAHAIEVS